MAKKINVNIFEKLEQPLEQVQECRQGKRTGLRVTLVPSPAKAVTPKEIRRIRRKLEHFPSKSIRWNSGNPCRGAALLRPS